MTPLELVILEFLLVAITCGLLIKYYRGHMVKLDVVVTVYLSWVLGFSGILLLPYDVSLLLIGGARSQALDEVWRFVYWSTFALAWGILPIQNEFHNSGEFTFGSKLCDAVKRNLMYLAIAAVIGIIYIVYMVVVSKGAPSEVIGFLMAMGNTYGMLIITLLMGNGLVALPRRLWQIADDENELRRMYIMASTVESAYQEARFDLEDCELEVQKAGELLNSLSAYPDKRKEMEKYVEILQKSVANFNFAGRSNSRQYISPTTVDQNVELNSKNGLVLLHAKLKQAQIKARACDRRWRILVKKCHTAECLLRNGEVMNPDEGSWCAMKTEVSSPGGAPRYAYCKTLTEFLGHVFTARFIKTLSRVMSVVCGVVSIVILWSELVMASTLPSPVGAIMGAYGPQSGKNAVLVQAICFLALLYMSACTYWSLFRLNLGWAFTLQGPQQSPPASLIFNGEYFSRLQFALGYNFLLTLNISGATSTSFGQLMSNMKTVPAFGTSFTVYIPIIMILVAVITLFNGYARIMHLIGVDSDDSYSGNICCSCKKNGGGGGVSIELVGEDLEKFEAGKKLVASEIKSQIQLQQGPHDGTTASRRGSDKSDSSNAPPRRGGGMIKSEYLEGETVVQHMQRLRVEAKAAASNSKLGSRSSYDRDDDLYEMYPKHPTFHTEEEDEENFYGSGKKGRPLASSIASIIRSESPEFPPRRTAAIPLSAAGLSSSLGNAISGKPSFQPLSQGEYHRQPNGSSILEGAGAGRSHSHNIAGLSDSDHGEKKKSLLSGGASSSAAAATSSSASATAKWTLTSLFGGKTSSSFATATTATVDAGGIGLSTLSAGAGATASDSKGGSSAKSPFFNSDAKPSTSVLGIGMRSDSRDVEKGLNSYDSHAGTSSSVPVHGDARKGVLGGGGVGGGRGGVLPVLKKQVFGFDDGGSSSSSSTFSGGRYAGL